MSNLLVDYIMSPVSNNGRSQDAEQVTHIREKLLDQTMILFNSVPFQMGTSLKGTNLLREGANYFFYELFLIVWKITFITLSDLP